MQSSGEVWKTMFQLVSGYFLQVAASNDASVALGRGLGDSTIPNKSNCQDGSCTIIAIIISLLLLLLYIIFTITTITIYIYTHAQVICAVCSFATEGLHAGDPS